MHYTLMKKSDCSSHLVTGERKQRNFQAKRDHNRSLSLMKYAERFLHLISLKNFHTGSVYPHFATVAQSGVSMALTELQQQQKRQNRAARMIIGSNYGGPSKPLLQHLSWKMIEDLFQYEAQIIVYKFGNGLVTQFLFFDMFVANSSDSSYNLRNTSTELKLSKKISSNGQEGFSCSVSQPARLTRPARLLKYSRKNSL